MTIDWWTLGLQAINFLVLVWLLQRVLYRPVLAVIEKRRQATDQALEDARRLEVEAAAARQRYEDASAGIEHDRKTMLDKAHSEIDAERVHILEQARAEAERLLVAGRDKISVERDAAIRSMREEIADLGADMARTILAQLGDEMPAEAFLTQVEAKLAELPDSELSSLCAAVSADGGRLEVTTAAALDEDRQADWSSRLRMRLGHGANIAFSVDPELIAGVELHFPHSIIAHSVSGQIEQARKALATHDAPA